MPNRIVLSGPNTCLPKTSLEINLFSYLLNNEDMNSWSTSMHGSGAACPVPASIHASHAEILRGTRPSIQREGERGRHSVSIHDIYDTTDGPTTATGLARTALVAIETLNVNSVPEPKVPISPCMQSAIVQIIAS